MTPPRLVLILESQPNAISQMRRVLAGMRVRALAAFGEESLREVDCAGWSRDQNPARADRCPRGAPERQRHSHAGGGTPAPGSPMRKHIL